MRTVLPETLGRGNLLMNMTGSFKSPPKTYRLAPAYLPNQLISRIPFGPFSPLHQTPDLRPRL